MKKSRSKRAASRKSTTAPASSRAPYVWAAAAAAAAVILIAIAIIMLGKKDDGAVVTVNGERITQEQLDFQYNLLPQSYRQAFSPDQILEQIIDEELVVQAAERDGLSVGDDAVNQRVQDIMAQNELSVASLQENLAQFNVTQEQFESLIRRQLLIDAYLNKTLKVTTPDEQTLNALYSASKSKYTIPEQVTARHVLVSNQRTDAALIAKEIYDEAQAGGDFCALALNRSDDRGSRDTCGEYTFPRGVMDPVFENAAFGMKDGEISLVQTRFGYHIIKRINITPEHVRPFEEVRPDLEAQYASAEHSKEYRSLISDLRSQATIIYANGTKLMPQRPASVGPTGDVVEQPPAEEPETAEQPSTGATETPVNETANETGEAQDGQDAGASTGTQVVISGPITVTGTTTDSTTDELLACIAGKSVLYGTSWSTDTQDARKLFENAGTTLTYVQCDTDACSGIKAYPTWEIGGTQYLGRMSVEQLKNAAGC